MSDTMTREERRGALDEFAASAKMPEAQLPAIPQAAVPQIVGAQMVAVRRDTRHVLSQLKELAAAAGSDWYYRFPVQNRREGRTDWIEGPSIKLANDLARLYGNCEVDCRATDLGSVIMYHARFIDVETGFALTRPFQQRKGAAKLGGSDEQRREDITFQIGASKAIRNVVVNALQTFADFAFEEAKNALVEKIGRDLVKWRDRVREKIGARVDLKRVEAVIGRTVDNWLAPDIARVIAMGKAVEDGMASLDETFPPLEKQAQAPADSEAQLNAFADEKSMVNDEGAGGGNTPSTAASDQEPPSQSDAADFVDARAEIVEKIIRLGSDAKLSTQERLEALELYRDSMVDGYPAFADFLKTCATTAARVAKEEMSAAAAKKYLQGLIK